MSQKKQRKRNYYVGKMPISLSVTPGVKIWTNGIPMKADTYKSCSVTCGYCFARSLTGGMNYHAGVKHNPRIARIMNLPYEALHFKKALTGEAGWMYWCIRNRYFIEFGTMAEAFQMEDEETRVTWSFLQLAGAYKMPLFINSKGPLLVNNENYYNQLAEYPAPVIMSMTLIGTDDKLVKKNEPNAPLASERLKLIRRLRDDGIPTVVYMAPFIKGVSDVDPEGFVEELIDAGAVGIHIRNLYLTGQLFNSHRWMKYKKEHADDIERHGQGHRHKPSFIQEYYIRMQEHAEKIDPRFKIVGLKSSWFELGDNHGKLSMDWMPEPFKKGIMDITAIPILRKIRENADKPQILSWSNMGYDPDKVSFPRAVPTGEGWNSEAAWLNLGCMGCIGGTDAPRGKRWMDGWEWVKGSLWNGLKFSDPFLTSVKRVYNIVDKDGNLVLDDNGDRILAYIPPEWAGEFVEDDGSVLYDKFAKTVSLAPTRPGGTEDKWADKPELTYDLGERWKQYETVSSKGELQYK